MRPLFEAGKTPGEVMELAAVFGAEWNWLGDPAVMAMYHAQQEHAWMRNIIESFESGLEDAGLLTRLATPPAVSFLDLSGYTRLTEERGDAAAADLASSLASLVQATSADHGGRPVKWLGDGVMFVFTDPGRGVLAALEMVARIPSRDCRPRASAWTLARSSSRTGITSAGR
jgi:class 3 adenylate cyclase